MNRQVSEELLQELLGMMMHGGIGANVDSLFIQPV
jgi:hypothetical protein